MERNWFTVLSRGSLWCLTKLIGATLTWILRRLESTSAQSTIWRLPSALLDGCPPGKLRSCVTGSLAFTCPNASIFTAIQPTSKWTSTGSLRWITGAATSHPLWAGRRVLKIPLMACTWSSASCKTQLRLQRQTDGATTFLTLMGIAGTQKRTTRRTFHTRASPSQNRPTTDLIWVDSLCFRQLFKNLLCRHLAN